jgi:phage-related minor tail protein
MALDMNAAFRISAKVDGQQQLDRFNQSLKTAGQQGEASAGQIRNAMRTLPAQFTDIAVSLQGGMSPFTVLLQQGGQIRDQFGSVGAALRGIASLITPFSVAVAGAAAAVGGLAAAFVKGEAESVNFNRALAVTNNYAGQTADRFNAAARRVQESANVTAGAARELVQAVVASGRYGPASIDVVASAMGNLQRVTGLATKDVQQQFAGLSRGAADWAAEMNRTYNFLDVAQYRYIRRLEEAGDKEGAMREAAQALDRALAQREQNLGTLERAWKAVGDAAGGAWQAMLNIGREDTLGEQIATLERRLKNADDLRNLARSRGQNVPEESADLQAARAQLDALRETQRFQVRAADAAASRARANQQAIEDERKAEAERKKKTTERISEFDRLRQQLDDQMLATRDLGVAEKLVAEIQAGRYKELTKAQQDTLIARAREVDYAKLLKEQEDAQAKRAEEIARKRDQAANAEARQNEAAKQKWIDLIDPTNKYIRQLEEIRSLVNKGVLTPDQGMEAEFRVQEQISDQLDNLKTKGKDTFKELKDAVEGWGRQATDAFVNFAFGAKTSFGDLVSSILKDIARMMIQKNVTTPLFNAISGFNWGGLFGFADGGIMTGAGPAPLRKYANGGIANSPQVALYGEGSTPEAFVPLPDGRTIPVTLKGAGGGGAVYNITVPVTVEGGSPQVSEQSGAGALGKAIAAAVRAELINQRRPGGMLAAA